MAYHSNTGDLEVLLEGLYFANGVQLSPEGDHLLVTETTSARIIKYENQYSNFVHKLLPINTFVTIVNRNMILRKYLFTLIY